MGQQSASPLDPFLREFLLWAGEHPDGFGQLAGIAAVAARYDWQPAFAEALFTSAKTRGLIEPYYGKRTRGRSLWHLSKRGRAWLAQAAPQPLAP